MIVTLIVSEQVPHETRVIERQTQFTIQQLTPNLANLEIHRLREAVLAEIREATQLPTNTRMCSDGKLRVRRA